MTDEQYRPLAEALDGAGFKPAEHWTGQGRADDPPADSHGGITTHEAKVLMKPGPAETKEEFIVRVKAALGIPPQTPGRTQPPREG